jgi:hypothetical protein
MAAIFRRIFNGDALRTNRDQLGLNCEPLDAARFDEFVADDQA